VLSVTSLQLCVKFVQASLFVKFHISVLLEHLRSDSAVVGVFVVVLHVC
jgi:hypothetical protein